MNIFDHYLDKIKNILLDLADEDIISLPEKLDGINTEIPPEKFNCDLSTNVGMVLSKINKKNPIEIAQTVADTLKKKDPLEFFNILKFHIKVNVAEKYFE